MPDINANDSQDQDLDLTARRPGPDDPVAAALKAAVATLTPGRVPPFEAVLARRRRRRQHLASLSVAASVAVLATGAAIALPQIRDGDPQHSAALSAAVPQGWEPVASLGIEIYVPKTWRVTGAVNSCSLEDPAVGTVSRPIGAVTAAGCLKRPPGTLITFRQALYGPLTPGRVTEDGHTTITWVSPDRTAAVVASGVDAAVLQRVIDTARPVTVDSAGCATAPPELDWDRPRTRLAPVRLTSAVTEVVGCVYTVDGGPEDDPSYRLVASRTFTAAQRAALATALRRTPAGAAIDVPQNCSPRLTETEYAVLHVREGATTTPITLHWTGCVDRYVASQDSQSAMTVRLLTTVMDSIQVGYAYGQLPQG